MSRKKLLFICISSLILISILFSFSVFIIKKSQQTSNKTQSSITSKLEIKSLEFDLVPGGEKELNIQYPQFIVDSKSNTGVLEINKAISERYIKEVYNEQYETYKNAQNKISNIVVSLSNNDMYLDEKLGIFSFVFNIKSNFKDGTVKLQYVSYVFNVNSGNRISLSRLIDGAGEDAVKVYIENEIQQSAIMERPACYSCVGLPTGEEGTKLRKNIRLKDFLLSESGITFFFGSGVLGQNDVTSQGQKIFVPNSYLKKFIQRNWNNSSFDELSGYIRTMENKNNTQISNTISGVEMYKDILPLYNKLEWVKIEKGLFGIIEGRLAIDGQKIYSEKLLNRNGLDEDVAGFVEYYDLKLKSLGWDKDSDFDADGPLSSQSGYYKTDSKGNLYFAFINYSAKQDQDTGGIFSCPCTMEVSIIIGKAVFSPGER